MRAPAVLRKRAAVLRNELRAKRVEPRIANRRRGRDDEFPISRLLRAQLCRALQEVCLFVRREPVCGPTTDVEAILLMLIKLAGDLDEITALHRVAGLVVRTVAPDAQRHAIAGVREDELAIRLLFAGEFCRDRFELHVDSRFERPLRHSLANFFER